MGQRDKVKYNFIPSNLNIDSLNLLLTGKVGCRLITCKVLNFYSIIIKKLINSLYLKEDCPSKYVFINQIESRALLGDKYVEIIKILVDNNYLLEDSNWIYFKEYRSNNRTKSYSLPEWMYSGGKFYRHLIMSDRKVIKNMVKRYNNLRVKHCKDMRAEMISSSQRIRMRHTPESMAAIQEHIDKVNNRGDFKFRINAEDMLNIFNLCPFDQSIVDFFGKRVHTKITNLPKVLRQFLYFDNRDDENLECVDIVNSQPALMATATPELILQFTPELNESSLILKKYQYNVDLFKFKKLCANGGIYETIMKYFMGHGIDLTRKEAKVVCYTCFFGDYFFFEAELLKDEVNRLAYEFLYDQFKGVYEMFREMKEQRWQANEGKVYANNCMLAQRLESQIFYTILVPAIWEAGYRDFTTIHDSIIAPVKDIEGIKGIMINEFKKLKIQLKVA